MSRKKKRAMPATTNAVGSTSSDIALHTKKIEDLQRKHEIKVKELERFGVAIEKMQRSIAQSQKLRMDTQQPHQDQHKSAQPDMGFPNERHTRRIDEGFAGKDRSIRTCRQVSNALNQSFAELGGGVNPTAGQIHPDRLLMMNSNDTHAGNDHAPPPAPTTTNGSFFANLAEPGRLSPYQDSIVLHQSHEKHPDHRFEADPGQRPQPASHAKKTQDVQIAPPTVVGRPNSVLWSDQAHQDQVRLAGAFNHAVMRAASLTMFIVPVPYNETFKRFDMLRLAHRLPEPEGYQTATSVLLAPIHYEASVLEATQIARLVPDMFAPDDELKGIRHYLSTQAASMTMWPEPTRKHSEPDFDHDRVHKRPRIDSSVGWRPDLVN